ncbi:hypothetical protein B0H13DRAFT_2430670 [Mycena leptocephala]|nr:hypothetical protein B0H13DRAFT_2430670 [Mycena leptocephala]
MLLLEKELIQLRGAEHLGILQLRLQLDKVTFDSESEEVKKFAILVVKQNAAHCSTLTKGWRGAPFTTTGDLQPAENASTLTWDPWGGEEHVFLQPQGVYNRGNKGVNELIHKLNRKKKDGVKASLSIRRTICGRISREELKKKYPHSRRAGCDGSSHEESAKEIVGEPKRHFRAPMFVRKGYPVNTRRPNAPESSVDPMSHHTPVTTGVSHHTSVEYDPLGKDTYCAASGLQPTLRASEKTQNLALRTIAPELKTYTLNPSGEYSEPRPQVKKSLTIVRICIIAFA